MKSLIFVFLLTFLLASPVMAVTSTSSTSLIATVSADTPVASDSDTVKKELQERIQNVVDEKLKNTQEKLDELNNSTTPKRLYGYVGHITEIRQNIIDLNTSHGNFQIKIEKDTAIIKEGRTIKPEQLSIRDKIIAIGRLESSEIITARRLVVIKDEVSPEKRNILAKVTKINSAKKTLTLSTNEEAIEVTVSSKTKLDFDKIKANQLILGTILIGTDKTITLTLGKII